MLLEGGKLIEEAMQADYPLEAVWFTAEFLGETPELVQRLTRAQPRIMRRISAREMRRISSLETAPGIVAVAPEPEFQRCKPGDQVLLIVALALVQDPGNLGGVIRTADFFGVDELWLGEGSADPYNPKTIRGGMGALFRMPVFRLKNLKEEISAFRKAGAEVIAAVAHSDRAGVEMPDRGTRLLLIGGESRGLTDEELALADRQVCIPGAGRSESLNLAVAAGILIHAARAKR